MKHRKSLRHLVSPIFNIIDSVLVGHVISASQVPTRIDCAFECLSSLRCVSYNYEEGNKVLHECELNSERKESKSDNFTGKAGYSYYGTKENVSNSCSSWESILNTTFTTLSLSFQGQWWVQVSMAPTLNQHILFTSKASYSFGISNPVKKTPVIATT